jgi:hypothetical protein
MLMLMRDLLIVIVIVLIGRKNRGIGGIGIRKHVGLSGVITVRVGVRVLVGLRLKVANGARGMPRGRSISLSMVISL